MALASVVLVLGGCSAFDAAAHGSASASYDTASDFARENSTVASWLPLDAASITLVTSTRAEGTATIRYESTTSPDGCETAARTSAPTMDVETDLDIYGIDSVLVCDEWAVAGDGDEWVAWTPATEAE